MNKSIYTLFFYFLRLCGALWKFVVSPGGHCWGSVQYYIETYEYHIIFEPSACLFGGLCGSFENNRLLVGL